MKNLFLVSLHLQSIVPRPCVLWFLPLFAFNHSISELTKNQLIPTKNLVKWCDNDNETWYIFQRTTQNDCWIFGADIGSCCCTIKGSFLFNYLYQLFLHKNIIISWIRVNIVWDKVLVLKLQLNQIFLYEEKFPGIATLHSDCECKNIKLLQLSITYGFSFYRLIENFYWSHIRQTCRKKVTKV